MGGEIVVSADGASGSAPLKRVVPGQTTFTTHTFTGDFFNNSAGNGAAVFLGRSSAGGFFVMASYAAVLSNGARYIGVARFSCK